jgi:hypothetical protein
MINFHPLVSTMTLFLYSVRGSMAIKQLRRRILQKYWKSRVAKAIQKQQ